MELTFQKEEVKYEEGHAKGEACEALHRPREHTAQHIRVGKLVQALVGVVGFLEAHRAALEVAQKDGHVFLVLLLGCVSRGRAALEIVVVAAAVGV